MSYTTRESFDAFTPLREAVNRFMEDGLASPERLFMLGRTIPVDILEKADEYVIEASLIGVKPENVHITTAGNTLTIHVGHKAHPHNEEEATYLKRERIERHTPEMTRTLSLPERIDPDKVSAEYEHGLLTVRVGKNEETKPRTIPLHVAKTGSDR